VDFRRRLAHHKAGDLRIGWAVGQEAQDAECSVVYRFACCNNDRVPEFATELVRCGVDCHHAELSVTTTPSSPTATIDLHDFGVCHF
jgi:hypothetical protein